MIESKSCGLNISIADAWIAATAISLQIPLIASNEKNFQEINGLTMISEK